ncbi:hypothetical protein NOVOSPHI9U_630024 [Novosphingobium sp. 9U]|nr:hypothetical protein NOVOSPHI9U_630024 [Novosphingobium sp. 9U]
MDREHKGGWVYIMADRYRGTMYVGVTADLGRCPSTIRHPELVSGSIVPLGPTIAGVIEAPARQSRHRATRRNRP